MRVLKFRVDGQVMRLDPDTDVVGLVPGSEGYLEAQFTCSSEWDALTKVVGFWSALGVEYTPQALDEHGKCVIPVDAAKHRSFKIGLYGKSLELKLTTNKVEVIQGGGVV